MTSISGVTRWAPAIWVAAALAALWIASAWPGLASGRGSAVGAWGIWLLATAAALHRPLGGSGLGLGAAAVPLAVVHLGAVWAAALSMAAVLVAELVHRQARQMGSHPPPERRHVTRSLSPPAAVALAVLAAGIAWKILDPGPLRSDTLTLLAASFAGGIYAVAALIFAVVRRATYTGWQRGLRVRAVPILIDLAGWLVGAWLAVVALGDRGWVSWALLAAFAALAVEAARNGRLVELSEQKVYGLEKVNLASWRMNEASSGMASVADRIRSECRNVIPILWFQFELVAGEDEEANKMWSASPSGQLREGPARPGPAPPALPGIHRRAQWRILAYPLKAEGRLLARLTLWCDPRRLVESDEALLVTLLPQLAASVHRELLDHEAKSDPLTGLTVRRVLERRLLAAYVRSVEEGGSMAVVMCDLDHFKAINDSLGHDAGDRALKAVADILRGFEAPGVLCSRYGGEEFTLLLENAGSREALDLADRLRRAVEAAPEPAPGLDRPLTVSCGVAAFPELHIKTATELLLLADEALYEAKRQGRNRCLANLGRGRFVAATGRVADSEDGVEVEAPRFFA